MSGRDDDGRFTHENMVARTVYYRSSPRYVGGAPPISFERVRRQQIFRLAHGGVSFFAQISMFACQYRPTVQRVCSDAMTVSVCLNTGYAMEKRTVLMGVTKSRRCARLTNARLTGRSGRKI